MSDTEWVEDALTLAGNEIPTKLGWLNQADLRFYPDNPRIYSIIRADEDEPTQVQIEKRLGEMDHVKKLVQSIMANGGLTDPLIVKASDNVVLEGNSRLAAYRLLARNDPIKWGKVKVCLLPEDIGEDLVFILLGEYHIIGKKDWAPYEQAGYLYRRFVKHKTSPAAMAKEMGETTRTVTQLISVYDFMVQNGDNKVSRWSYYDEYLKHNAIKKARKENPKFDQVVVDKIKSGDIPRAVDVRDGLVKIAKAGGKVLKDFVTEKTNFERSCNRAVARGVDNTWLKRFNRFRLQVVDKETITDLEEMTKSNRDKCIYELRKIHKATQNILDKLT